MPTITAGRVTSVVAPAVRISRKAIPCGEEPAEREHPAVCFSWAVREKLILDHLPLVNHVLSHVGAYLPPHVDRGDLRQVGTLGLIHAADRFDPGRHVRFSTYAMSRIRGAMLDALRSADWAPRSVRRELVRVSRAGAQIAQEVSGPPTAAEIAKRTGLVVEDVARLKGSPRVHGFYPLSTAHQPLLDGMGRALAHDCQDHAPLPPDLAILEEEKTRLADAILRLSRRQRLVITLYYFERLPLCEVGAALGVTASRACQIHRAALKYLRRALSHHAFRNPPPPVRPIPSSALRPLAMPPKCNSLMPPRCNIVAAGALIRCMV